MFDINILISEVNVLQMERVMYGSALNVIANQGHLDFSQMLHSTKAFKIIFCLLSYYGEYRKKLPQPFQQT
jgi:hypothetical protein